jgi:hypothetical protein
MMTRIILVALLALPATPGGAPWDKVPEKWNLADVSKILQESPWSPAGVKLEGKLTLRYAAGESVQQAYGMARAVQLVANECDPFEADRLGFGARCDREPFHDSGCGLRRREDREQAGGEGDAGKSVWLGLFGGERHRLKEIECRMD